MKVGGTWAVGIGKTGGQGSGKQLLLLSWLHLGCPLSDVLLILPSA